jgi:hypothetical protein
MRPEEVLTRAQFCGAIHNGSHRFNRYIPSEKRNGNMLVGCSV